MEEFVDDIEFVEDEEEEVIKIEGGFDPIIFSTSQRRIQDLNSDYANGDLDPRPSFQRGYVWDRTKASRLVESVLLNVPIPLIYTAEESDGREVVIDGQQRLLTLMHFIKGEFPRDTKKFRLSKLSVLSDLNGKSYEELDEDVKRRFRQYTLTVIKIHQNSQDDVKFEIFERLNTGSVKLNAQELRNCVYRGPFNELLRNLANDQNFRSCLGSSRVLDRMQDAELILRFLAFYDRSFLNYNSPMKSFLNGYMNENRNIGAEKTEKLTKAFKHATELSHTVFGSNAFRKFSYGSSKSTSGDWEKAVNRALFDVVMWGFTQYEKRQIVPCADTIRDEFILLCNDDAEFKDAITQGTGDKSRTLYRFEAWRARLKTVVGSPASEQRSFEAQMRQSMFKSDPRCKICGQMIRSMDDCEVDHIMPYSKGGATDQSNAQLAHRHCNRSKSNQH